MTWLTGQKTDISVVTSNINNGYIGEITIYEGPVTLCSVLLFIAVIQTLTGMPVYDWLGFLVLIIIIVVHDCMCGKIGRTP